MIGIYGGGNVSTCGFSSGGALALGIAAHNNAQENPLPQPRHIVAVSLGEVPWNDAERMRMQALNEKDVAIDYAFMVTVERFMRHGRENVPDYMISGSRGDFSGVGDIHFFYSADEVLYGALPDFEEACKRADVPYTAFARPKMVHCYCMLPYFKEAREDFAKITDILKKQVGVYSFKSNVYTISAVVILIDKRLNNAEDRQCFGIMLRGYTMFLQMSSTGKLTRRSAQR